MIYACFEPVYLCHGSEFAELRLQMLVLPSFLTLSVRIHLGQLKCFEFVVRFARRHRSDHEQVVTGVEGHLFTAGG